MKFVLFAHGKEGSPHGTKAHLIKNKFMAHVPLLTNSYAAEDFKTDLGLLTLYAYECDVLVGSSRGGALIADLETDKRKILICPAWKTFGADPKLKKGDIIIHSKKDDLVPYKDSEILAERFGCTLIESGSDHRMGDKVTLELIVRIIEAEMKGEKS